MIERTVSRVVKRGIPMWSDEELVIFMIENHRAVLVTLLLLLVSFLDHL